MDDRDTLSTLAEELGRLLAPLEEALSSPENFAAFMRELGWNFQVVPAPLQALAGPSGVVRQKVDEANADPSKAGDLIGVLRSLFSLIEDLATEPSGSFPATVDADEFKNDFPGQLVQFLVVEYLEDAQPGIGFLLKTLGLVRERRVDAAGLRPAYRRKELAFADLAQLLDDPLVLMRNAYRWGQSDFDVERLTVNLGGLLSTAGLEFQLQRLDPSLFGFLTQGNTGLQPYNLWLLSVPLVQDTASSIKTELGIGLYYLPETATAKPGFAIAPYARGNVTAELDLTETLRFVFEAVVNLNGGIAVVVRPDQGVQVFFDIIASGGTGTGLPQGGRFTFRLVNQAGDGQPIVVFGAAEGSRLEYRSASLKAGVQLTSAGAPDLFGELELTGAKVVVRPGDGVDSFLGLLLPDDGFTVEVDLAVGLSSGQGLYFRGSGGLEISLPAHIQLGPIEVVSALLAVKPGSDGIPVELGGTIKGDLGVLSAVVENLGLRADLTLPASGGNLGPANLSFAFKPPNGVGLAIDAGVVKGEYAGALELTVSNFLSLKAIGLINTRMPGGQPGFSLLVIITAEFSPGFQLGFGFTLLGVGGLLGLNRAALLDPLVQGVRTGAVNSILFPTNVVANAPKILSDLRAIFPPKDGTFLIGPMAKIGWGTPPLVTVSLGVIIEIPGNVVILGRLRAALPTEDQAVLVLQVSFIGALEFDKRRLWFFASMFESRVLFITLQGEMGLLMDFSDNPNFVLSVGGFHPRFAAPPLPFPSPARIALSLVNEEWARVRVETYFAITSNSVQMGCRAEAFFGFDALSVEGYFSFDALLRFSPFYLIVEISAGFSVKVFGVGMFGVHLRASLEGPTPWHIRGSAEIEILFFSISVDVDVTFGERRADVLPPIEVLPTLRAEFEKLESWQVTAPPAGQLFVSLRELGSAGVLVLHPVGSLRISQRFAPLNLPLDKIGNQRPSDIRRASASVQAGALAVRGPTKELFAAAQYRDMDDAAKLSAPAYEPLDSGVELGAAGQPWATGPLAQRNVRYETITLDTAFERVRTRFFRFWDALFVHFHVGAAVARAPVSRFNEQRLQPFSSKVTVAGERYAVAFQADNRAYTTTATFDSFAEASAHMAEATRLDPALSEQVHVIPTVEVNTAR
jgi:hypothetical protein